MRPIEFKPRSVIPIKTGDLEKRELFEEVGRAIVYLSDIESWLVSIAYHLTIAKVLGMEVPNMFYAIFGFEKRLQFANLIVELEATDDEKARWKKITSALHEHRGIRNLVAHYAMGTDWRTDDGRTDVFLQPPDLKDRLHPSLRQRPVRLLRVKEVRNPSLPANWGNAGDFAKMQGETELSPANSLKISIVWMQSPYSRSRETIIFSRGFATRASTQAAV